MGSPTLTELQGRGRGVRTGPISFHEPSPLPWRKTPCLPGRAAFPPRSSLYLSHSMSSHMVSSDSYHFKPF